jgi:phage N-6-adenine-methyltransferase
MNTKVMFSSITDEWRTPQKIFDELDKEFSFDSDPCPMEGKPLKEGLYSMFMNSVFVNPPYSNIALWVKEAYEHHKHTQSTVVMLIPSRTDTKYWHEYIMKAKEIRFIKGRLKFGNSKNSAPFPSCVVVFK